MIFVALTLISTVLALSALSPVMSSTTESIMVHALDCTAPEGFVCVAPDRERDHICDTRERYNIPVATAEELNVFANTCS